MQAAEKYAVSLLRILETRALLRNPTQSRS